EGVGSHRQDLVRTADPGVQRLRRNLPPRWDDDREIVFVIPIDGGRRGRGVERCRRVSRADLRRGPDDPGDEYDDHRDRGHQSLTSSPSTPTEDRVEPRRHAQVPHGSIEELAEVLVPRVLITHPSAPPWKGRAAGSPALARGGLAPLTPASAASERPLASRNQPSPAARRTGVASSGGVRAIRRPNREASPRRTRRSGPDPAP